MPFTLALSLNQSFNSTADLVSITMKKMVLENVPAGALSGALTWPCYIVGLWATNYFFGMDSFGNPI